MKKYIIFPICNRKPDRAPKVFGHTFILCWRCTMVAISAIITTLVLTFMKWKINRVCFVMSNILLLPMVLDGGAQYFWGIESNNLRRGITGILFGIGTAIIAYEVFG